MNEEEYRKSQKEETVSKLTNMAIYIAIMATGIGISFIIQAVTKC